MTRKRNGKGNLRRISRRRKKTKNKRKSRKRSGRRSYKINTLKGGGSDSGATTRTPTASNTLFPLMREGRYGLSTGGTDTIELNSTLTYESVEQDPVKIKLIGRLGRGSYGMVYKGSCTYNDVVYEIAVKFDSDINTQEDECTMFEPISEYMNIHPYCELISGYCDNTVHGLYVGGEREKTGYKVICMELLTPLKKSYVDRLSDTTKVEQLESLFNQMMHLSGINPDWVYLDSKIANVAYTKKGEMKLIDLGSAVPKKRNGRNSYTRTYEPCPYIHKPEYLRSFSIGIFVFLFFVKEEESGYRHGKDLLKAEHRDKEGYIGNVLKSAKLIRNIEVRTIFKKLMGLSETDPEQIYHNTEGYVYELFDQLHEATGDGDTRLPAPAVPPPPIFTVQSS